MTKIIIAGALLFFLYRLFNNPMHRNSHRDNIEPPKIEDDDMVDYEEIE